MKLCMLYACLIAMFLFSATAVAEILPWGEGTTSGSASATASPGGESDYEDNSGDNGYYTTEAGTFQYYCEVITDVETLLSLYGGGWGRSLAISRAESDYEAESYLYSDIDYTNWVTRSDTPTPKTGSDYFDAYTGVFADWVVITICQIEEGTASNAYASAYAFALAAME